jgi:aspartyl-tRNA(Asn)/glutamyl-tRNA(Gln) amidotransferase subunit A
VIHERDMQERPQDYARITLDKTLSGAFIPASKYIKAQQLRRVLCQEFADAMRDLDAVITLSSLDLPTRLDDPEATAKTYDRQCRLVFNVTGTPTISVPTGFSASGLPLAMQISSRAFDDAMVYRAAQAYCEATGFADKRAPIEFAAKVAAE